MPEAAVHETSVAAIVKANEPAKPALRGAQTDAVVLTGENFGAYVDDKLGVEKPAADAPAADSPEAKAAEELKKVESDKKARAKKEDAEAEEIDHPDKSKKERLNSRFSELTEKRKAAEAKAQALEKTAKEAQDRADAAERTAQELRTKYEPPKADELGAKPELAQFVDATEWGKALEDWTADKTRRDDAAKQREVHAKAEHDRLQKTWNERVEKVKEEDPDFDAKLDASPVRISDQARDAIFRSDVGPEILAHLSDNPQVADDLGKLTVGEMLYSLGRLAATLGGSVKAAAKASGAAQEPPKVEISRAPAPIAPLSGNGSGVARLNGGNEVPKNWTYEDFKKARQSGQIQ